MRHHRHHPSKYPDPPSIRSPIILQPVAAATTTTITTLDTERLHDVIPDILSRLPTKSVVRFKSVNNQFFNIISDPWFAKHHTRHSPKKVEGLFHLALYPNITLTSFITLTSCIPFHLQNPIDKLDEKLIRGRNKLDKLIESSVILDSCNGLVVLGLSSPSPSCYCVLNPATNKFQLIPIPPGSYSCRIVYQLRLAYDAKVFSSLDYNLVHVFWERFLVPDREVYNFKIFSSDTNSWRESKAKLTCNRSTFLLNAKTVYLNGSVHWVSRCGDIIAFDVKKEQARIINLPQDLPKNCFDRAWFGVVGGLIYLVYVKEVEMVVRILHDYKNGRWYCVKNRIKPLGVHNDLYPIFFDDQCLILKSQNTSRDIFSYNLKSNEWWTIGKLPDSMESSSTNAQGYGQDVFSPFAPTLARINHAECTSFTDFLISGERKQVTVDAQHQLHIRPKRKIKKPARFNDYYTRWSAFVTC